MQFTFEMVVQLVTVAAVLGGIGTIVRSQSAVMKAMIDRLERLETRVGKVENRMTAQETRYEVKLDRRER